METTSRTLKALAIRGALLVAGGLAVASAGSAQEMPAPAETSFEIKQAAPAPLAEGRASWYGARFHGRRTASGEPFDMHGFTAAHKTLPFGTLVRVLNPANGREVVVRINDRGPHVRGRIIDLSRAAAAALGFQRAGQARVVLVEH